MTGRGDTGNAASNALRYWQAQINAPIDADKVDFTPDEASNCRTHGKGLTFPIACPS
jgi:hypothetical protein